MVNIKTTVVSVIFIIVGALLVRYALLRPCEVAPITQTVMDQVVTVEQPEQMDRLICLSTDYMALIATLIGTASIFPGVGGLFRGLTADSATGSKGKKKKKK